ncbi:MAG: OmpH family outer membrane protein [Candidatus Omnitrophota bacterium]
MRNIITVLVLIVALCSWTTIAQAQEIKIGYINLKKLLDDYKKVADGEGVLLKQAEGKNAEREKMVNDIKALREKIELMDEKQKVAKQTELDDKVKALQDYTYQTRADLRQDRDEKFREIMQEIKTVIEEYGKSNNYNLILDDTLILYKQETLDVTEPVVKMLNERYKQ